MESQKSITPLQSRIKCMEDKWGQVSKSVILQFFLLEFVRIFSLLGNQRNVCTHSGSFHCQIFFHKVSVWCSPCFKCMEDKWGQVFESVILKFFLLEFVRIFSLLDNQRNVCAHFGSFHCQIFFHRVSVWCSPCFTRKSYAIWIVRVPS